MTTMNEVVSAIEARNDIQDKTKKKYIKKFKTITQGCTDTNFIDKFNDMNYIINDYLKGKSDRTIETYVGEIFAIHHSKNLLTKENFEKLDKFKFKIKYRNEALKEPIKPAVESIVDSDSEVEEPESEDEITIDYEDDDIQVKHMETQTEPFVETEDSYIDYIDGEIKRLIMCRTEYLKFKNYK